MVHFPARHVWWHQRVRTIIWWYDFRHLWRLQEPQKIIIASTAGARYLAPGYCWSSLCSSTRITEGLGPTEPRQRRILQLGHRATALDQIPTSLDAKKLEAPFFLSSSRQTPCSSSALRYPGSWLYEKCSCDFLHVSHRTIYWFSEVAVSPLPVLSSRDIGSTSWGSPHRLRRGSA